MKRTTQNRARAFTMIELMLVISIMIILGLLAALGIAEVVTHANRKETQATMRLMAIALDQFHADMGIFPLSTGADEGETIADALTDPKSSYGWKRASFATWFENRDPVTEDDSDRLRIVDAWNEDLIYTSSTIKVISGAAKSEYDFSLRGVERTPGKEDYYNLQTFQLYSKGPNMRTWATTEDGGHDRLGGTERDDIRNWIQKPIHNVIPTAYQ